ncbi:RNA polymerase sigma factor [Bacillus horti]|uniref:RNA polymerase sigma-70 factor (ECF subfamily) n=1 Tax=Caldalkalibacillus horti TaxID=77523 RepID=A0ABT9W455_9BACI|nr:sigma-70 family RNA polymerase sigma factor [Bacillus horti]MDQ0168024.1 RNA polymerase sigma-70 factor (ECF subfamily) [Bacillus horti]
MEQDQWLYFLRTNFYELDHNAQKITYNEYRKLVYRDIYFLYRNHELAEDIVQETFFKVVDKAPKAKSIHKAWIIRIARNYAYDLFKKNKKYHHVPEPQVINDKKAPFLLPTVADQVEDHIRNEILHEALQALKPVYRQVLFMYYIEEKSYNEIAQKLGTSEQALAQMLVRARKKLYHYFSKRWVDADE